MTKLAPLLAAVISTSMSSHAQNQALTLDGTGDFVEIPNHGSLHPPQALTIECWARVDAPGPERILTKGDGARGNTQRSYDLSLVNSQLVRAWLFFEGGAATMIDAPVPDGEWHHIAVTFNSSAGEARVYVDGNSPTIVTTAEAGTEPLLGKTIRPCGHPLLIGKQSGAPVWDFGGDIDRLRLWNRARTQEEIRCTINSELTAASSVDLTGLVSSWNFENGFADDFGANHGVPQGDAASAQASMPVLPLICGSVTGEPFCFASGDCVSCPCGNDSNEAAGCLNSNGTASALVANGVAELSNDTLRFDVLDASPESFAILVSAQNLLPQTGPCTPGDGISSPLLDGLRCVGGNLRRHGIRATDSAGSNFEPWGPPGGPSGGLLQQGAFAAGQSRAFQAFYRDDASLGCGTGQNTTNAIRIQVAP